MKKVHAKKLFKKILNCGSALNKKMCIKNKENVKNMNCGSAFKKKVHVKKLFKKILNCGSAFNEKYG